MYIMHMHVCAVYVYVRMHVCAACSEKKSQNGHSCLENDYVGT